MTLLKFQNPRTKHSFETGLMFPSINNVLDNIFRTDYSYGENSPAVNVSENETEFQIEYLIPGFKKEDIKVALDKNILTVSGETKSEEREETKKHIRKEFSHSTFKRSFTIPENIDVDSLKAKHENGVLHITLPKIKEVTKSNTKEITIS